MLAARSPAPVKRDVDVHGPTVVGLSRFRTLWILPYTARAWYRSEVDPRPLPRALRHAREDSLAPRSPPGHRPHHASTVRGGRRRPRGVPPALRTIRVPPRRAAAFDDAFVARDLDTFLSFVRDDAVQVDYRGHVFANKAEIATFTAAVMANEFTFTHTLITQTINRCTSAHVVQDTVFAIPGLELHLLDAVTWILVRGEWKVSFIHNTQFA